MSVEDRTDDDDVIELLEMFDHREAGYKWLEQNDVSRYITETTKLALRVTSDPTFAAEPWLILVVRR